jgi:hypothetical protein
VVQNLCYPALLQDLVSFHTTPLAQRIRGDYSFCLTQSAVWDLQPFDKFFEPKRLEPFVNLSSDKNQSVYSPNPLY